MKPRGTHSQLACQLLDPERLVELMREPLDGASEACGVAVQQGHMPESGSLLADQEPIDNLSCDQRHQNGYAGWGLQESDETHHSIQQVHIHWTDGDSPHPNRARKRGAPRFHYDCTDERRVKFQAETEEWLLLRG